MTAACAAAVGQTVFGSEAAEGDGIHVFIDVFKSWLLPRVQCCVYVSDQHLFFLH